ncbi:MAG: hypothetical protein J7647_19155 [Cyanobacteria bacterium SBLK]|nr:hypothetical protein [Cyanobacteria bacterium SBLK]
MNRIIFVGITHRQFKFAIDGTTTTAQTWNITVSDRAPNDIGNICFLMPNHASGLLK